MKRVHVITLGLASAAFVGAAWLVLARSEAAPASVAEAPQARPPASAHDLLAPTPPAQRGALRDPVRFERWMQQQSSLRGTDLDGGWDVVARGQLHPTIALRRRFDQLLTLAGEAKVEELTAYIEQDVRDLAGPMAAAQVLEAWQRYITLQRHAFRSVDPKDPQSLQAAHAERQQVRRQLLGLELATAFFAEEEAQFAALLQQRQAGAAEPPPVRGIAIDRQTLAPEALARLQKEEAAWADWERRLAAARDELSRLQAAAELSDLQRRQQIEQLIAQRFDAKEAVRVRALLHLSPA